jgi:hypothetical protein
MDHGGAHEVIHWAAAVVLVIGGAIVVVLSALARRRSPQPSPVAIGPSPAVAPSIERSTAAILATLSLGAAAIHLAAAPSHYVELGDLGAGFLVAAALQAAWARAILGGTSRRVVAWGIAINGTIAALWLLSRTAGLPIGPSAGIPEPVGLPDGASTAFELLLLAGLAARALDLDRRVVDRFSAARPLLAVAIVPVLGLVMLTTSLASLAIVAGAEHGAPGLAGGHATMIEGQPGH